MYYRSTLFLNYWKFVVMSFLRANYLDHHSSYVLKRNLSYELYFFQPIRQLGYCYGISVGILLCSTICSFVFIYQTRYYNVFMRM